MPRRLLSSACFFFSNSWRCSWSSLIRWAACSIERAPVSRAFSQRCSLVCKSLSANRTASCYGEGLSLMLISLRRPILTRRSVSSFCARLHCRRLRSFQRCLTLRAVQEVASPPSTELFFIKLIGDFLKAETACEGL
jgi:hypothetical protein